MKIILTLVCVIAIAWRGFVAGVITADRIKSRVPSPILNVILWDSLLLILLAGALLAYVWDFKFW